MKSSNIVLSVLLVTSLFFITAFAFIVNDRYDKRQYESTGTLSENFQTHRLKAPVAVVLQHVSDATLVPSDSFMIAVRKEDASHVQWTLLHDTLTLVTHAPATVRLYLPDVSLVKATRSSVTLRGMLKFNDPGKSYRVELDHSTLSTATFEDGLRVFQHYYDLTVHGLDSTHLILHSGAMIAHLSVTDVDDVKIENDVIIKAVETEYQRKKLVRSRASDGVMEIEAR